MAADEQHGYDREFLGIWLSLLWNEHVRPALLSTHRAMVAAGQVEAVSTYDPEEGRS